MPLVWKYHSPWKTKGISEPLHPENDKMTHRPAEDKNITIHVCVCVLRDEAFFFKFWEWP